MLLWGFGIEVGIPIFVPTFLHFLNLLVPSRYRSHVMIKSSVLSSDYKIYAVGLLSSVGLFC